MTNLEARPSEVVCAEGERAGLQVVAPRAVPLGGPRAMTVRRTLPTRERSLIGAWCFCDHYGPDDVAVTGGMTVAPHPHTGLQTVSWLFAGEIEHRDSAGNHAMVRPGELNLMTGGHGISHSEISTPGTTQLHGVQLWVALPRADRDTNPGFAHHVPAPVTGPGWEARVFLGSLLGDTSPVPTCTPLVGAEIVLEAGSTLDIPVDERFEHGVLLDTGEATLLRRSDRPGEAADTATIGEHELGYAPPGVGLLTVRTGEVPARFLVLGGTPFGEEIVMWWNFVAGSHEEIVEHRAQWQEQITGRDGEVVDDSQDVRAGRFGTVVGDHLPPIPAPPMPNARLRPRS